MKGTFTQFGFALLVLITSAINLKAQSGIDSLSDVRVTAEHDTVRLQLDLALGSEWLTQDADSAQFYFDRAHAMAQSLTELPSWESMVLYKTGLAYKQVRKREEAINFFNRAMTLQKTRGLKQQLAMTQFEMGQTLQSMSKFEMAILHYDSIISRNLADNTDHYLAMSYNYSGLCNYYLRRIDKASTRILEAIRFRKETGDTARIHYPYMVLGLILKEQKKYEEGKAYIRRSREIARLNGALGRVALAYTNIGQILIIQDSLDAAFESLTEGWKINEKRGVSPVSYLNNVSWVEEKRGNYQAAHDYAADAVRLMPDTRSKKSKADVLISLAEMKMMLADSVYKQDQAKQKTLYRAGVPLVERAWKLAAEANAGNVMLEVSEVGALVYLKSGNSVKAFEFSQRAKTISEEINNQNRIDALAKMNADFEAERIAAQTNLLKETQKAQEARLEQQRFVIYAIVLVLVLILVIATVIYRGRLKLKKANVEIEKSLSEKELLLKEIHHRVKNNLQVVSSLLDLQSRGIEDEEALATFMEGQNRVKGRGG